MLSGVGEPAYRQTSVCQPAAYSFLTSPIQAFNQCVAGMISRRGWPAENAHVMTRLYDRAKIIGVDLGYVLLWPDDTAASLPLSRDQ